MPKTEKKIKWNLKQLYKDSKDPQIEMDIRAVEMTYDNFITKYKDKDDYLHDENALLNTLKDYESMYKDLCVAKPYLYFAYRKDLNSKDAEAEAKMNLIAERFTKNENRLIFFTNKLAKVSAENKYKFLKSEILKPYHYYLKVLFQHGDHMLSEPEEKILNLKAQPSHALWVQGLEKVGSRLTVKWKGKNLPLSEAVSMISSLPTKDRYKLDTEVTKAIKTVSDFAESEVNAVVIDKKIEDDLRGYKKAYSGTVMGYQNEEETVENLVKTVSDNFRIAHRFYTLKAKLLGLNKLKYCDRAAPVGKTSTQIKFKEGSDIVRKAFAKFNPIYSETFESFIKNGQLDVYPEVGKTGGAYCSSAQNMPTFVLLNYTNRLRDVTTLAHEMGHAIHAKLSFENQPTLYRDHTISTAEVASTLFENFVFDEILPTLPKKEQIVMLHDKINDEIATVFRQTACFNFEKDLHTEIRSKGVLQKEEIANLMNKRMAEYLGPKFKLQTDDGYFFIIWSHIRRFFYVYSYAFGEIVSRALYAEYKKDPKFEEKIRQFLSAGGSDSPENIFKNIGIDVRNPEFFLKGLRDIEGDIIKLENLIKEPTKKKK